MLPCRDGRDSVLYPCYTIHFESSNNTCSLAEVGGILYYILVIQSILNIQIIPAPLQRWGDSILYPCYTIHFESSNNTCSLTEVGGILYYILLIQSIFNLQIIPAPLQRWEGFYTISLLYNPFSIFK